MTAKQKHWIALGGIAGVVLVYLLFIRSYISERAPEYPGELLVPATLLTSGIVTVLLGAASYFAARTSVTSGGFYFGAKVVWVAVLGVSALVSVWYTLFFAAWFWPYWLEILK